MRFRVTKTVGEYIDAVFQAENREAAYRIVREAYDQAGEKTISVQDYQSVWIAWDRRWFQAAAAGGNDFTRGGPRQGSNWTGD